MAPSGYAVTIVAAKVRQGRAAREDRQLTSPANDSEREELNRRSQGLRERLSTTPPAERDEVVREMNEIARQLRELDLDDRLRSSMEGGSEG